MAVTVVVMGTVVVVLVAVMEVIVAVALMLVVELVVVMVEVVVVVLVIVEAMAAIAGVMTAKFAMSAPLDGFSCCWRTLVCRPMVALDRTGDLQARMPSYHVCSSLAFPALPQFPNQEPLRPQQLVLPDFAMMPHLGHTKLVVAVVAAGVGMWVLAQTQR